MGDLKSARRIDELGRVVIPKEIRKATKMQGGDLIEIFIEGERVCIKKYSPLKNLATFSQEFVASLSETTEKGVMITDLEKVISVNKKFKDWTDLPLTEKYKEVVEGKKTALFNRQDGGEVIKPVNAQADITCQFIIPLFEEGSLIGSLMIFGTGEKCTVGGSDMVAATFGARFLERQFGCDEK